MCSEYVLAMANRSLTKYVLIASRRLQARAPSFCFAIVSMGILSYIVSIYSALFYHHHQEALFFWVILDRKPLSSLARHSPLMMTTPASMLQEPHCGVSTLLLRLFRPTPTRPAPNGFSPFVPVRGSWTATSQNPRRLLCLGWAHGELSTQRL